MVLEFKIGFAKLGDRKKTDAVQKGFKGSNTFWDNLQQKWQNGGELVNE